MSSTRKLKRPSLRILIAEDTELVRWSLRRLIGSMGHCVDAVQDGLEAIKAVRRETYDLVLLDVQMPGMGGVEAAATIYHEGRLDRWAWVVAMSAGSETELGVDRAYFDRFLEKPVRHNVLKVLISDVANALPVYVSETADSSTVT